MKRKASALWKGSGAEGSGVLNGPSGVLQETPYSFTSRFKNEDGKKGTNPEELLAASHAGCYAMALSFAIANAGFEADYLDAKAEVTLDSVEGGFAITGIALSLKGKVSGMEEAQFMDLAKAAKEGCPISKALAAVPISLDVTYEA